jgi:hypothetical protein
LLYLVLEIKKGPIHPPSWSIDPFTLTPLEELYDVREELKRTRREKEILEARLREDQELP